MQRRLGDIVRERAVANFTGREAELDSLLGLFAQGGPLVVHVHGVAGVGKTSLMEVFAARARDRGAQVVRIDCRAVEPSPRGFIAELSAALGDPLETVHDAADRLASFGARVILILDTYEVFRLLDTWMRLSFAPSLPVNARVVIADRNPPSPAWRTAPGWQGLFRALPLEPLAEKDALAYLARSGVALEVARRINRLACGHPLALSMAASIVQSQPGRPLEDTGLHHVIDELSRSYLEAVPDATTRRALEASSVVRCVTEPLLHALLPEMAPRDVLDRLGGLPFVELGREGLFIHDAVRNAIATSLAARDPDAHRAHRHAAWVYLQDRIRGGRSAELWRHMADLLFLVENPVLREGFFPSGPHPLTLEPATAADEATVRHIISVQAEPELDALAAWWRHHPGAFRVVRDHEGTVCGFYVVLRGPELADAVVAADPVAAAWRRDASKHVLSSCLFSRRWLDRDVGEAPCAAQAASWIDIKRLYLEMRTTLRWVYMAVTDPQPYAEVATRLGFRPLAEPTVEVEGQKLHLFVLDLGPGSVDVWLARLVGAEIASQGTTGPLLLDIEARELILPSGRVGLTALELGVMRHLEERAGKAVSRFDLMEAVWGYRNATASNVVDVVVGSLRRKLGVEARRVETVRGTGYRYRPPVPVR